MPYPVAVHARPERSGWPRHGGASTLVLRQLTDRHSARGAFVRKRKIGHTVIELPARLAHRGPELKLVLPVGSDPDRKPDPVLVKLVVLAKVAQLSFTGGEPDQLVSHYSKRHLWQLLRISWLAPDIVAAIVGGTQPATLTGRRLLRATDNPLEWKAQRAYFQFD